MIVENSDDLGVVLPVLLRVLAVVQVDQHVRQVLVESAFDIGDLGLTALLLLLLLCATAALGVLLVLLLVVLLGRLLAALSLLLLLLRGAIALS